MHGRITQTVAYTQHAAVKNVTGFDANEFCLKAVRVEVFVGFVFINLDPNAPALASQVPGLDDEIRDIVPGFDRMVKVAELRSEIRCNWKVAVDNYLECYHCKSAHPAFANLVDLGSYRSKICGIHSSHIGERVNPQNKAYAFSPDDPVQRVAFWYLWPFTVFNVYPGRADPERGRLRADRTGDDCGSVQPLRTIEGLGRTGSGTNQLLRQRAWP